jgi:hypothetical protein
MKRRGRPAAPRVTFEAVKRDDGLWHVLALGEDTGYKFKTVYKFRFGDDAQFMVRMLNEAHTDLPVDFARFNRLHKEGAV